MRHHLLHALPHAENAVLVVGFCPPSTLGGALLAGATNIHLFGETIPVNAEILQMHHYSAHADRTELIRYINCNDVDKVSMLILVHCVPQAAESFRDMALTHGFADVMIARKGETIDL